MMPHESQDIALSGSSVRTSHVYTHDHIWHPQFDGHRDKDRVVIGYERLIEVCTRG